MAGNVTVTREHINTVSGAINIGASVGPTGATMAVEAEGLVGAKTKGGLDVMGDVTALG